MNYIFRVNGEERPPTPEERLKITRKIWEGLGYRPVKEDKKAAAQKAKGK